MKKICCNNRRCSHFIPHLRSAGEDHAVKPDEASQEGLQQGTRVASTAKTVWWRRGTKEGTHQTRQTGNKEGRRA